MKDQIPLTFAAGLGAIIAFFAACTPARQQTSLPTELSISILDEALARPDVLSRISSAQRDLPTDVWKSGGETRPGPHNLSRVRRELELTQGLLSEIVPKLKTMSSIELVMSLKTYRVGQPESFCGVTNCVYRDGNHAIIEELRTRRRSDLKSLGRPEGADETLVFTGDNGPHLTLGRLLRDLTRDTGPQ